MSVLIVGCGYLGLRVGRRLADRHEQVYGTTRTQARADELVASGIQPLIADVLDPTSLARLPQADQVIYCVGSDRSAAIPLRTLYCDGLSRTLNALSPQVRSLVYVSSTSVYGQSVSGCVDEDSPTLPVSESGRVCLEAEQIAAQVAQEKGFELRIVRFSGLYGPGRIVGRDTLLNQKPIPGDPDSHLNLIQIEDAASALIRVLDAGSPGRLYLASDGTPLVRRTYYSKLAQLIGSPPLRFLTADLGPDARLNSLDKKVSIRRIKAELGFEPNYPDAFVGLLASLDQERAPKP